MLGPVRRICIADDRLADALMRRLLVTARSRGNQADLGSSTSRHLTNVKLDAIGVNRCSKPA
jgi:hypothetical protein